MSDRIFGAIVDWMMFSLLGAVVLMIVSLCVLVVWWVFQTIANGYVTL